jgi:hypothetical protein
MARMRRRSLQLVFPALLAVLAGAGGCGGGHAKSASTPAGGGVPRPLPPGSQRSVSSAFAARNLVASDFAGFQRALPSTAQGASAWVAGEMFPPAQAAKEVARLRRLGFVAGLAQHLQASDRSGHEGLLIVEQFGSTAAAHAEAAAQYKQFTAPSAGGPVVPFVVTGVPGARAYKATSPQFDGYNVLFADGRYYYLIGAGWAANDRHPPSRALVVTAAQHEYQRVHALPGG